MQKKYSCTWHATRMTGYCRFRAESRPLRWCDLIYHEVAYQEADMFCLPACVLWLAERVLNNVRFTFSMLASSRLPLATCLLPLFAIGLRHTVPEGHAYCHWPGERRGRTEAGVENREAAMVG
jgi:hypothetical protein